MNLYITADRVGIQSGGGIVTKNEYEALCELGPTILLDRERLKAGEINDPWGYDDVAYSMLENVTDTIEICHFYAGTFSKTVNLIKKKGGRTVYTCAAHSKEDSREEHIRNGFPYPYTHLTDPVQWQRYNQGYLDCDVLVVPSTHSATIMREYGRIGRMEVVPHGVHLPERITPLPKDPFVTGYLGSVLPDKGVIYLLQAWKQLDYKDAILVIGGRDSTSETFLYLVSRVYGAAFPNNIKCLGWLENVSDFYNKISLYVQPSATEGFGIEIIEAMAHARPVISSLGAGGHDVVPDGWKFDARDVKELAAKIDVARNVVSDLSDPNWHLHWRKRAEKYDWKLIRERYKSMWRSLV